MFFQRRSTAQRFSEITERLQRLEQECARQRARIEGDAALRVFIAQIGAAALSAPMFGSAFEGFAVAMRRPLTRGRAGGLARVRQVRLLDERWPRSGKFMAHADWEDIEREIAEEDYMRYAAGGFVRANSALRAPNGTFLPDIIT